ncbi:uncharacterized protein DFL_008340 [Arthrobotrys flagrans]|uniref:Uncharacterized protein n=1 Tax=Arthrobotrys flagrans TaxID=97331 RepID=A0A436ZNM4_ARTFL|nr:hypothetical protein DFL_008340 [Arthrobotrys flagrans]
MAPVEVSRIDPPSPPRPPNPPPPSPETKKYASISTAQQEPMSRSRQDPPSPPRAPPPSPTKTMISMPTTPNAQLNSESPDSFPRLVELTMTLGDVLDLTPIQTSRRDSYLYCEDDMSVPGSPPPLDFSTPKPKYHSKRRAEDLKDYDIFGPCLSETPASDCKRRKAIDLGDNIVFLPSDSSNSRAHNRDFFSLLFSSGQLHDTTLLHEHIHGVQSCA